MIKRNAKSLITRRKLRLSTDFIFPATWQEIRIHELFITNADLISEIENLKLEQLKQRQQIKALAGAINVLLGPT